MTRRSRFTRSVQQRHDYLFPSYAVRVMESGERTYRRFERVLERSAWVAESAEERLESRKETAAWRQESEGLLKRAALPLRILWVVLAIYYVLLLVGYGTR